MRGHGREGLCALILAVAVAAGVPSAGATLAAEAGRGAVYYVSPAGDDAAAGSVAAPWKTVARALRAAGPGVTVNLRAGVYSEELRLTDRGGADGAPFTLQSADGERAVFDGGLRLKTAVEVRAPHVVLRGLEIRSYTDRAVFARGPAAHHLLVERNVIHHICDSPTGVGRATRGVWTIAVSDLTVRCNTIYALYGYKECTGVFCDLRSSDGVPIHNVVIEKNLFYLIDKSGVRIVDNSAERRYVLADPAYIRGNISIHSAYVGLEVNYTNVGKDGAVLPNAGPLGDRPGAPVYVEDNFVGWCSEFGMNPKQSAFGVVRHNTIYATEHIGYLQSGRPSHDMQVTGNLLIDNVIGGMIHTIGTNNRFTGNYYRQPRAWPDFFWDRTNGWGTTYSTMEELRGRSAIAGIEAGGVLNNTAPVFRAREGGDFRLIAGCPAAGTAPDGQDFGARASALTGVGASGKWGLANIPLLPEVKGMRVLAFSGEDPAPCPIEPADHYSPRSRTVDAKKTAAGHAAHLVDGVHCTAWRPARGRTAGWAVIDLPGDEPTPLGCFMINVAHDAARGKGSPRDMVLYGRLSQADAWREIGRYSRYEGEEGRIFPIWPMPGGVGGGQPPAARQLKLEVLNNHGAEGVVEIGEFRLYRAAPAIE